MKSRKIIPLILAFVAMAFLTGMSSSSRGQTMPWGIHEHPLKTLGPDFSLQVPVVPLAGAKAISFNFDLARFLHLEVPKTVPELEKIILDLGAYWIDPSGRSTTQFLATYYQDSRTQNQGDARGDGRKLIAGELAIPQPDGSTVLAEVSLTGMGATALAWTNRKDGSHQDGLLSAGEGLQRQAISVINRHNQLDGSEVLALIQVPDKLKQDWRNGKNAAGQILTLPSVIEISVGRMFRVAHLRLHSSAPAKFQILFDFILRRDLDLPADTPVTASLVKKHYFHFVNQLADEAARLYDLQALHGAPTAGNRATFGSELDHGNFEYFSSYFKDYKYLYDKLLLGDQAATLAAYASSLARYTRRAHYPFAITKATEKEGLVRFQKSFANWILDLKLRRLGLSRQDMTKIPQNLRARLFHVFRELQETKGSRTQSMTFGPGPQPVSLVDSRDVLAGTMGVFCLPEAERMEAWRSLFKISSLPGQDQAPATALLEKYKEALGELVAALNPTPFQKARWNIQAAVISHHRRVPGGLGEWLRQQMDPVIEMITKNAGLIPVSETLMNQEENLEDHGLSPRQDGSLGSAKRLAFVFVESDGDNSLVGTAAYLVFLKNLLERQYVVGFVPDETLSQWQMGSSPVLEDLSHQGITLIPLSREMEMRKSLKERPRTDVMLVGPEEIVKKALETKTEPEAAKDRADHENGFIPVYFKEDRSWLENKIEGTQWHLEVPGMKRFVAGLNTAPVDGTLKAPSCLTLLLNEDVKVF